MTLVRWSPFVSTLLDSPVYPTSAVRRWVPQFDLVETADHYVVHADLPGLGQDDVAIEVEDRVLTISGERATTATTEDARALRVERAGGSFRRQLTLPEGVDADGISATFENGVLTISVPKPVAIAPRRVEITPAAMAA